MGHSDGRYLAAYNLNRQFERDMIYRWALMVLILVPPAFLLPEPDIDNLLISSNGTLTKTGDGDVTSEYVTPFCYVCDSLVDPDCRESQDWMPRRRNGLKKKIMRTRQGDDDNPRLPFDWKEVYVRLEKFKQRCPSNDGCTTHIYLNSDRVVRRCFDPKEPPSSGYEWISNRWNPRKRTKVKVMSRLTCGDWPFCNVDSAYYWPNGTVEALVSPHDDPELKLRSAKLFCYECDSILEPQCTGQDFVRTLKRPKDVVAHSVDWAGLKGQMGKYRIRCPVESGCFFYGDHMTGRVTRGCRNMTTDLPQHLLVKDRRKESTVFMTEEVCRESDCNSRLLFFSPTNTFLDSDWQFSNKTSTRADVEEAKNELWDYQGDSPVIEETLFLPRANEGRLRKRTIGDMEREERRRDEALHPRTKRKVHGKGRTGRARRRMIFLGGAGVRKPESVAGRSASPKILPVILFFLLHAQC